MKYSHALTLSVLASSLAAQAPSHVSPPFAATAFGKSHNNIPFAAEPNAYQQIHDATSISGPALASFQKLRLRMAYGHVNENGTTVETEIFLGECPTPSAQASAVFAQNIMSGTETNVLTRKLVALPKLATNDWGIAPFVFDAPWVWQGRHVEWRAIVYGNSSGNQQLAYGIDAWDEETAAQLFYDTGCNGPGALYPAALISVRLSPGSSETFWIDSQVLAVQPATLNLGTSRNQWGSISLPFDLGPLGAPGCYVRAEGLVSLASTTNPMGLAAFAIQVPNSMELQGDSFFAQGIVQNSAANPLGVYTTQGLHATIGMLPIPLARIWTKTMPPPPQGTLQRGFGLSVAFN